MVAILGWVTFDGLFSRCSVNPDLRPPVGFLNVLHLLRGESKEEHTPSPKQEGRRRGLEWNGPKCVSFRSI